MPKDLFTLARSTRYPLDAFVFVQQGLEFTVKRIHGEPGGAAEAGPPDEAVAKSRHVNGRDLCVGLRDYALDQYGLLARLVLQRWHILTCEDFGHIVFAMVEAGVLNKTEEDSLGDFIDVYSFDEAFGRQLNLNP